MPIFLLVAFAIMEWGWFFYQRTAVVDAVRVGCREGAMHHEEESPDPVEIAQNTVKVRLMRSGIDCDGAYAGACDLSEVELTGVKPQRALFCKVRVDYKPLIGDFVPSLPTQTDGEALFILEQQP